MNMSQTDKLYTFLYEQVVYKREYKKENIKVLIFLSEIHFNGKVK